MTPSRRRCLSWSISLEGYARCVPLTYPTSFFQLVIFLFYLSITWGAPAYAQTNAEKLGNVATDVAPNSRELFLEVKLNGVVHDVLMPFLLESDGQLYVKHTTLDKLGVALPSTLDLPDPFNMAALPETTINYDASVQRLIMIVPAAWLTRPIQDIEDRQSTPAYLHLTPALPGALLNYDLYAQHASYQNSLSAITELRTFSPSMGRWSNALITRWNDGASPDSSTIRLDTTWQYDSPATMTSVSAGDLTSSSLSWSRSVRMGGIQIGRNFGLQPYHLVSPLPGFGATAVLPSTVDLFINGIKQSTQSVLPGQFEINGVPSVNGAGQAQMVITDINGATRTLIFPLYVSAQLLQKGLSDWSVEMGTLRRNYGLQSFDYDSKPVGIGSLRFGLSNTLTLESHAEFSGQLQALGVGGVWLAPAQVGIFSASLMSSRSAQLRGAQANLGFQWSNASFNVALNSIRRTDGFRDIGSVDGGSMARASDTAFLGVNSSVGQLGISWISQSYAAQGVQRYLSISMSRTVFEQSSMSINLNRNFSGPGSGVYATLSIPLGRDMSSSVLARHFDTGNTMAASLSHSIPSEGSGWGWRTQADLGRSRNMQAEATNVNRYGQWTIGASQFRTANVTPISTEYSEFAGSLIWAGRGVYATQRVDDAFAIVDTNGIANVPVRFQNRTIGATNSSGLLLVNHLNAYQHNMLSIDTLSLPTDIRTSSTQLDAVPARRSGALVHFSIDPVLAVETTIVDQCGTVLPVGSVVRLSANHSGEARQILQPPALIGYDGALYLENPPSEGTLEITRPDGSMCRTALPRLPSRRGSLRLNPLTCANDRRASHGTQGFPEAAQQRRPSLPPSSPATFVGYQSANLD